MNGREQSIGLRRDDRAGFDHLAIRSRPGIPESGERKGLMALEANAIGDLFRTILFPFIEAVGHDQAALLRKRTSKAGPFGNGFSAGVDHLDADVLVFGPVRDQSPLEEGGSAALGSMDHGEDALGGADVGIVG